MSRWDLASSRGSTFCAVRSISLCIQAVVSSELPVLVPAVFEVTGQDLEMNHLLWCMSQPRGAGNVTWVHGGT